MPVKIKSTSGSVTLDAQNVSGDQTLTVPSIAGGKTLLTTDGDGSSLTGVGDLSFGGDTFGADKTIGSNDNYALSFETNAVERLKIDSSGRVTMPSQPAFNAYGSTSMSNLTGTTTVNFNSEFFDQNSNFNTSTYTFTAPVTGKYQINATLVLQSLDINHSGYGIVIETSNRNYVNQPIIDPAAFDQGPAEWTLHGSVFVDMDANDTSLIRLYTAGGTNVDIYMAGQPRTLFSGFLVC